ncbi:MATE family efflux transporter [Anaerotruncus rubiinfantis]|uniref:MATE family efflux transporter n=1 Tax=Anaerotruncus rubiinfantis TaxID=1720200 RepID=UPI0008338F2C|nr:MATE family efflux transporter [Anaerotruncus rubiinfantis]
MAQTTHCENGITEGAIWKQLLAFFFPILLGTFFQQLYNTADAIIVGHFVGKEALAAVGGATSVLINFLVNLFMGVSTGATVVIAQYYGARNFEEVERAVHTAVALALAAGVGIMAIGIAGAKPALVAMATPDDILPHALTYLRIFFLGTVASFLYNIGSGILRAVGDTRRPLYFLIVACLTNILLDLLFVVKLGLGVTGVAVATVLSQVISAVLTLLALCKEGSIYQLIFRKIRFYPGILKNVLQIGLPAGIQSDMYAISNILLQACINGFGTNVVAAWTAFGKVDGFYWLISAAYGLAITTFVGQNFGAQKYDRVRKSVRVCMGMIVATTVMVSILFCLFAEPLLQLFTNDVEVLKYGVEMMLMMAPFYLVYTVIEILSAAVRGAGEALVPMLIVCGGVCVLRVLWIFFVLPFYPFVEMVVISYPVTWAITAVLFIIYYLHGGWLRRCIAKAGFSKEGEPLQQE